MNQQLLVRENVLLRRNGKYEDKETTISSQISNGFMKSHLVEGNLPGSSKVDTRTTGNTIAKKQHNGTQQKNPDGRNGNLGANHTSFVTEKDIDNVSTLHRNLHIVLAGQDLCYHQGRTVTCTLITSGHPTGIKHHLVLAAGSCPSVADYMDNDSGQILKITTTHSSLALLNEVLDYFPESQMIVISEPNLILLDTSRLTRNWLTSQAVKLSTNETVTYNDGFMNLELHENTFTCFLTNIQGETMASVSGSLVKGNSQNEYEDILIPLYDLNDPNDELDVTIIVMEKEHQGAEATVLYQFIAGELKDSVDSDWKHCSLTTVCVKNDVLYDAITNEFRTFMRSLLDQKKIDEWEEKSLPFVITSKAVDYRCPTITAISPSDPLGEIDERLCFTFDHPTETDFFIRVFEPASPADAEFNPGTGNRSERVRLEPQNRRQPPSQQTRGQGEKKMDPDTRNLLEGTQRDIHLILRKLHDHEGAFDQVVTAVVATKTDNSPLKQDMLSTLVLFGGFLTSKSSSLLKGDGRSGLVLSIQRIFHKKLRDTIRDAWKVHFAGNRTTLAKPPHAHVDKAWLEAFLKDQLDDCVHRIQLPKQEGSQTIVHLEAPFRLLFKSLDDLKYRVKVTVTGCKPYIMDLTECRSTNKVINYNDQRLKQKSEELLMNTVESVLELPRSSSDESQPVVTISVSRVLASQLRHFSDDLFVMCTEGCVDSLPKLFIYHDPANMCVFQTFSRHSSAIQDLIDQEKHWPPGQEHRTVAKHFVYHKTSDRAAAQVKFDFTKPKDLRSDKGSKAGVFEIWSHERKPGALIKKLKSDSHFCDWLKSITGKSKPDLTREVQKVFDKYFAEECLPTSAKYASIHFRLGNLARPNRLGVCDTNNNPVRQFDTEARSSSLYLDTDNEAHIIFTDAKPHTLTAEKVVNDVIPDLL